MYRNMLIEMENQCVIIRSVPPLSCGVNLKGVSHFLSLDTCISLTSSLMLYNVSTLASTSDICLFFPSLHIHHHHSFTNTFLFSLYTCLHIRHLLVLSFSTHPPSSLFYPHIPLLIIYMSTHQTSACSFLLYTSTIITLLPTHSSSHYIHVYTSDICLFFPSLHIHHHHSFTNTFLFSLYTCLHIRHLLVLSFSTHPPSSLFYPHIPLLIIYMSTHQTSACSFLLYTSTIITLLPTHSSSHYIHVYTSDICLFFPSLHIHHHHSFTNTFLFSLYTCLHIRHLLVLSFSTHPPSSLFYPHIPLLIIYMSTHQTSACSFLLYTSTIITLLPTHSSSHYIHVYTSDICLFFPSLHIHHHHSFTNTFLFSLYTCLHIRHLLVLSFSTHPPSSLFYPHIPLLIIYMSTHQTSACSFLLYTSTIITLLPTHSSSHYIHAVSILGLENCQSFFPHNCPCTYGVP